PAGRDSASGDRSAREGRRGQPRPRDRPCVPRRGVSRDRPGRRRETGARALPGDRRLAGAARPPPRGSAARAPGPRDRPAAVRGALATSARGLEVARTLADDPADRARGCVGLAVLAEEGKRFDDAERLYEEALRVSPALPAALERYGNLELFRDRPARAAEL